MARREQRVLLTKSKTLKGKDYFESDFSEWEIFQVKQAVFLPVIHRFLLCQEMRDL